MKTTSRFLILTAITSLITSAINPIRASDPLSFSTLRQLGMGGVGIAQTYDASALYTNPAGLSEAKREFKLPSRLRVDINTHTLDSQSDIKYFFESHTKNEKLNKIDTLTLPLTIAGKASVSGLSWIDQNIGIGIFTQGQELTRIYNPTVPEVSITGFADISPMVGYSKNFKLFDTIFSAGATLRYISRTRILDPATGSFTVIKQSSDFITDSNSFNVSQTTMTGFGADIGTLMPLGSGKLGMVLRNIGTELKGTTTSGNAVKEVIPMYFGLGYAQKIDATSVPIIGGIIGNFEFAGDVRFQHSDPYKNIYIGLEKKFLQDVLTLRSGLHQGYPTAGVAIDAWILHLQYAFYTEEIGDKVGDNPQSYHALELGFLF